MTVSLRVPGRIHHIAGHTDYNTGFVPPVAVDLAEPQRDLTREDLPALWGPVWRGSLP